MCLTGIIQNNKLITPWESLRLHASNLRLALELGERWGVEMAPPLEQHGVADELEPRRELQVWPLEHRLQLGGRNIRGVTDFVGVNVEINVRLDEEDVIDCTKSVILRMATQNRPAGQHTLVLSPLSVTRSLVVYPGQELKFVQRNLLSLDAQLLVQLALSGSLDAQNSGIQLSAGLTGNA